MTKRSADDFSVSAPVVLAPDCPVSGKTVAVIGSGVAGLAAARDLALLGHQVTVFEKHETPGGMLNQGIPAFRLPRAIIEREISQIKAAGVEIRCGVKIGSDMPGSRLTDEFDAGVMAAGTPRAKILELSREQLTGLQDPVTFL